MTENKIRYFVCKNVLIVGFCIVAFGTTLVMKSEASASEMQIIQTNQKFDMFLVRLKTAIAAEKMGIVAEACADCGARSIGVTIPGNRVVMIFHPRFAVRMLKASVDAGIEAPLRLYVTEHPEGARLAYRKASQVFAPYATSGDLVQMARELDGILANIASAATR